MCLASVLEILPVQALRYFRQRDLVHLHHELPHATVPARQASATHAVFPAHRKCVAATSTGRAGPAGLPLQPASSDAAADERAADLAQHKRLSRRAGPSPDQSGQLFCARLPDPGRRIFQQFGSV